MIHAILMLLFMPQGGHGVRSEIARLAGTPPAMPNANIISFVRTDGSPEALMPSIRQRVREMDAGLALANVNTMDQCSQTAPPNRA